MRAEKCTPSESSSLGVQMKAGRVQRDGLWKRRTVDRDLMRVGNRGRYQFGRERTVGWARK